jgi:phage gp45-like
MMDAKTWRALDARVLRHLRRLRVAVRARVQAGGATQAAPEVSVEALDGERHPNAEVVQLFGFRSRQTAGEVVMVAVGGSSQHLVVVAGDDRDRAPQDLEDDEVVVWAPGGAQVRLKPDGRVLINGGGAAAARLGDGVDATTEMSAWMSAVVAALSALAAGAPATVPGVPASLGRVGQGSSTVEVG